MATYTAFAKTGGENFANNVGASLERMNPSPLGVGAFEIEDGFGIWEIGGYFSYEPDPIQIKILEIAHDIEFVISKVVDKDWVSHVRRELTPVYAGRFVLFGSHDKNIIPISSVGLRIEAAMAFGTGHHATTLGCLLAFDYLIRSRFKFSNAADIGCGTGVLAMAAARILNGRIVASDIDSVAVQTARANLLENGLRSKVVLVQGKGFQQIEISKRAPYDLIFANILARPLCFLAKEMYRHSALNGIIILSGILNRQAKRVERYYTSNGFSRISIREIGEWSTLILQRR
jgi:ribosomal protein L11 methyltransferase